ncbi:UDP-4-amino-4 [Sporomusaceae bacterium BoRhaA]|uniref:UDP-4-amino-4, 6-dideoxy-N-acetyl-beta-L-altrosamine transaminase n=1 Tax=Pelorhabdus rhamnosifermentans TaxID=2772457 RepID=UPI001C061C45|nr:UDP-4-amino-4,6-dideoxy-N-acetyl-beta-L-altrosamine transaminase [Pelorhabdus rhamnosifermentans]MBU2699162.1 UDP-4-amino-4 [Pelorhabdus rhamnosifermentans]
MMSIPYGRQHISDADIQAVAEVLQSDWLTQGPTLERFEQLVADYCGVRYAIAVSNATSALHISCLAAGMGQGDVAWTSPITFVASANCALYAGGQVDFVDIDGQTYNMSIAALKSKLIKAAQAGKLPKVVIPVHLSGQSAEMAAIYELSRKYGFTVIEDASHAIGGTYRNDKVGCCKYSDMAVFSFHPVKIVTTGEGGMVVTNRRDLYEELLLLRSHGITRDANLMTEPSHGGWYYQQISLGFNYRMTDIQAALGCSQMTKIDEFVRRRREIAAYYDEKLSDLPLQLPKQHEDTCSSYHLYIIRLKLDKIALSHKEVYDGLRKAGIMVNLHYIPVYSQPYYQKFGYQASDFPEAEAYYQEAISLPMYYDLSTEQQDYVIATLKNLLLSSCR